MNLGVQKDRISFQRVSTCYIFSPQRRFFMHSILYHHTIFKSISLYRIYYGLCESSVFISFILSQARDTTLNENFRKSRFITFFMPLNYGFVRSYATKMDLYSNTP